MVQGKEKLIKDIISLRRRVDVKKGNGIREIELFEEHYEKSNRILNKSHF